MYGDYLEFPVKLADGLLTADVVRFWVLIDGIPREVVNGGLARDYSRGYIVGGGFLYSPHQCRITKRGVYLYAYEQLNAVGKMAIEAGLRHADLTRQIQEHCATDLIRFGPAMQEIPADAPMLVEDPPEPAHAEPGPDPDILQMPASVEVGELSKYV